MSFVGTWLIQIFAVPLLAATSIEDAGEALGYSADFLGHVAVHVWFAPIETLFEGGRWAFFVLPALIALTQAIFLLPVARPLTPGQTGRRLLLSALAAGAVGGTLVAALAWAVIELAAWNMDAGDAFGGAIFLGVPLLVLLPGWCVWSWVLLRRSRRDGRADPLGIDRMLLPLLRGTFLAMAILVPIDVLLRRKKDCYCLTGSFFGLTLGLAALLWLVGPWIILTLSRRRRSSLRRLLCVGCGYPRQGIDAHRCPECGRWFGGRASARAGERSGPRASPAPVEQVRPGTE